MNLTIALVILAAFVSRYANFRVERANVFKAGFDHGVTMSKATASSFLKADGNLGARFVDVEIKQEVWSRS